MTAFQSTPFVGHSPSMLRIRDQLSCAARSDAKVLISGESGVGKEIAAREIHGASGRARVPLFALNCAGLPESLLESELFGHTRGSFTGAVRDQRGLLDQAHTGTVFLDEVGEMSLRMQAVLLRFLETGELQRIGWIGSQNRVDVRVISATNRNLLQAVGEREFRRDLYYRLNVIHIEIPALRDRREDIQPLVGHYLRVFAEQYGVATPTLSKAVRTRFETYAWPGNVRELKNVLERLVVMQLGRDVQLEDLPADMELSDPAPAACERPPRVRTDDLYTAMVDGHQSFWTAVYEPFMSRDLTRDDIRELVSRGLRTTGGSYKLLVALFNISAHDYRRFLNFLTKHQCHIEFQPFRTVSSMQSAAAADVHERVAASA